MDRPPIEQIPRTSCWDISIGRGEPLIGSASRVDVWFLLTYDQAMGAKAFPESTIPGEVKDYFNVLLESIPHSRLLLIKPHSQEEGQLLHVVNGREADPFAMTFGLDHYEQALELDLAGALNDASMYPEKVQRRPFFTVCTNGNRDPCCARFGLQAFRAFRELAPERIWRSSHVGGHRFAANVISFPYGIYYGRVGPDDVPEVLEAGERGEIRLENYRGRACHDSVTQAADLLLRQSTGRREVSAFRSLDSTEWGDDVWAVRFAEGEGDTVHEIRLQMHISEDLDFTSCRSTKKAPVVTYELRSHEVVPGA